ncbi:hypothetical protein RBSH_05955 [Rhodopirellula baltica SH28]|uniref:Uncharacterized protein n=1 Tax=Rhodopirellula baltica SH28 TaxID=993517 RepID=K5D8I1_RHOBT|nr:hypothetical protein RBSH_05955 [Rhodopirellula baltica SH28]
MQSLWGDDETAAAASGFRADRSHPAHAEPPRYPPSPQPFRN